MKQPAARPQVGPAPLPAVLRWRNGAQVAVLALAAACGGGDTPHPGLGDGPVQASVDCDADISRLVQAVYVSTLGADTESCGRSTLSACQSIAKGLAQCGASGCGVVVRHGLYPTTATLVLRDGVGVYGGCRFNGEARRGYRTTIEASPAAGTAAIEATDVNTPTTVTGLVVVGKDETAAGTASITLLASRSPGLVLTGNVFIGGRGGDGAAGASAGSPSPPGEAGTAGTQGGAGALSCLAPATPGNGGHGGTDETTASYVSLWNWDCKSIDRGSAGEPSGDGKPGGALGVKGAQGIACGGRPHDWPGDGQPGKTGPDGACGVPAKPSPLSAGRFDGTAWLPSQGEDGAAGAVGAGGGGGGAGGACVSETLGDIYNGLKGGGGGAGGCGGARGRAGQQGGASIPVVLADVTTAFDAAANTVVPGPGGRGGAGGNAAAGGTGGAGGAGQTDPRSLYLAHHCGGAGNTGGSGGAGGAGSAGAGGHGGPSIGVAVLGASAAPKGLAAVYPSLPGLPSRGGTAGGGISPVATCSRTVGADGANGVPGFGAPAFNFAGPPGGFLAGGEALAPGEKRSSPNGRYQLVLGADSNLCLMEGSQWRWCSLQSGFGGGQQLAMQTDGNLCLYTAGASQPACSNTSGHPGAFLLVQDDGRLVLSDGTTTLWARP